MAKKTSKKTVKSFNAHKFLDQGRDLASKYTLLIRPTKGGERLVTTIELPAVVFCNPDLNKCIREVLEMNAMAIATMLQDGQRPPSPASEKKREIQINIRLTHGEKARIEGAADRLGFRSISDYMRVAGLRELKETKRKS